MVRLAVLSLLLFAAPAFASDAPDAKALAVLPNFAVQTPTLSTSGKLQAGDVAVVAKAGIRRWGLKGLEAEVRDRLAAAR